MFSGLCRLLLWNIFILGQPATQNVTDVVRQTFLALRSAYEDRSCHMPDIARSKSPVVQFTKHIQKVRRVQSALVQSLKTVRGRTLLLSGLESIDDRHRAFWMLLRKLFEFARGLDAAPLQPIFRMMVLAIMEELEQVDNLVIRLG